MLAVDENLRYGPMKSGYHGGASPAEVVVPVTVLVPGAVPADSGLRLAPPQEPSWWTDPVLPAGPALATHRRRSSCRQPRPRPRRHHAAKPAPDLAKRPDETTMHPVRCAGDRNRRRRPVPPRRSQRRPRPPARRRRRRRVLASPAYKENKKRAGRVSVTDAQVRALLAALAGVAKPPAVPRWRPRRRSRCRPSLLRGAIMQAQQLLNIDGAAVIRIDADGATVILDGAALAEQYGIRL